MRESARVGATRQWNAVACGEVAGDKDSLEYFRRVETARYQVQSWQHEYFRYGEFTGKHVLEIGVGQGTDLMQFARAGAHCHGVDITDNHLDLTRRNFALNGKPVDLHKVDATTLPFADASLDCVYSFGVIHHIPEAGAVLAEVRRVLKPGGVVLISLYYKWSAFHLFTKLLYDGIARGWLLTKGYAGTLATIEFGADGVKTKPHVDLYSKQDMRALLAGFRVADVSIHQLHADHFSPLLRWLAFPWLCRALERKMGWYVVARAYKSP